MCDRRTDMYLSLINNIKLVTDRQTDGQTKKIVGVFLIKIFGRERRNENIIVSGTLKI